MEQLTPNSSYLDVLSTINDLKAIVKKQNSEISLFKKQVAISEENTKEEIINQNNNLRQSFKDFTDSIQKNLISFQEQISQNQGVIETIEESYTLKNDFEKELITLQESLEDKIIQSVEPMENHVEKKELEESINQTMEQINDVKLNLSTESKSINRKMGIFQKQEKYLLDMMTDLQTNVCNVQDSINNLNFKKTIDGMETRVDALELNSKKQIISLDETNKSDIGYVIQQAFSVNQDLSYLEIQLTGQVYKWDMEVVLPPHTCVKIWYPQRRHGYICKKRKRDGAEECEKEDMERCPCIIRMEESRQMKKDEFHSIYYRIKLDHYCMLILDGITIEESMGEIQGQPYTHGIFLLTGTYSSLHVSNSRISFSSEILVNGHGSGEKHVLLGHSRFLRSTTKFKGQSIVGCDRGKSWLGRRIIVSGTDVVCEQGITQTTDDENIEYLC